MTVMCKIERGLEAPVLFRSYSKNNEERKPKK